MLKAVIDTNVLISALLTPAGKPRQLVSCLEESKYTLFYPEQLLSELRKAPEKPRLASKLTLAQVDKFIDLLERCGHVVETQQIAPLCRDPDDDVFLACALAVKADYLVSGDKDLLCLKEHGMTKIVTTTEFLTQLGLSN